ncbi:MAG: hypothetical protein QNK37_09515 [Acidobacteriota bacterium]|nr:hypothetical protein [Acidobacteriota bacterium]
MGNHKEIVISEAELLELGISEFEPRIEMAFVPVDVLQGTVINGFAASAEIGINPIDACGSDIGINVFLCG